MRAQPFYLVAASALVAGLVGGPPPATADIDDLEPAAHKRSVARTAAKATWLKISGDLFLTNEADLLRVGNRLHVLWEQQGPGSEHSVRTRVLDASARPVSAVKTVVSGWHALVDDPRLLRAGGDLMAVFAGIRSSAPGDPYVGPAVFATSAGGLTWDLRPGSLSQTTAAGNASDIDAISGAGEPMFAMGGFGAHLILHRGTSPDSPASSADFTTSDVGSGASLHGTLANDRGTGRVYAGFNPQNSARATAGIFAQKVWPRPNGPLLHAPGSVTPSGNAIGADQKGFVAERTGGGVYIAYRVGYPTSKRIRVWEVGTNHTFDVRSPASTVDRVALTAGPDGRLWLSWRTVGDGKLHAARTNRAATRIGAIRTVAPPGGTGFIWSTALEGSRGPLDVIVNAQAGGSPALWAAHILPGLTVKASPRRLAQGRVTVTVTDAGQPVRGAHVSFRGHRATTNAQGKARFAVSQRVPDGRYPVAVAKAGYAKAAARVSVT
jgi:hypothetical protein